MSEPPDTPAKPTVDPNYHDNPPHLPLTDGGCASTSAREYRKGNWTLHETLILITAKRLDDERRIQASSNPSDPTVAKSPIHGCTGKLRWKWVENYCWTNGCLRSQNQCNDKWDNLLRDYKKVREYELRSSQLDGSLELPSYWAMDKQERKDRNLPSSMAFEVYEALKNVVPKKDPPKTTTTQQATTLPASPLTVHPPAPPPPPPSHAVAPPLSGKICAKYD